MGIMNQNIMIIGSTLPFLLSAIWVIRVFRRRDVLAE